MIPVSFKVEYYITRTLDGNGEFSKDQVMERLSMITTTNNLNEVFTDLFELHRMESIIGIEMINVSRAIGIVNR